MGVHYMTDYMSIIFIFAMFEIFLIKLKYELVKLFYRDDIISVP